MKSSLEFLYIANRVFGNNIDIKEYFDYPIAFKGVVRIFTIENYRTSFVICFDERKDFINALQLYVSLKRKNKEPYIYVPKHISMESKDVLRFISKNHISYIDHFGGMYTYNPNDRIDILKSMFDELREDNTFSYTKNVQLVLKFYFLKPVRSYTSREVADVLKISPSSVTRANEVLFRIGALEKTGLGAGIEYFIKSKKNVLKMMERYFIKPYEKSFFIAVDDYRYNLISSNLLSGQYALSEYSDLMPESNIPSFAVYKKTFAPIYNSYISLSIEDPAHFVQVQLYIYDPTILSQGKTIDLFDLYLTMLFDEDLNDPRIFAAFNTIKEKLING